jgi:hypothetical protein
MHKSTRTPTLPIRPSSGHLEPRYVKATILGAERARPFKVRLRHLGPHLKAALAGFALAHLTEQQVRRQLNNRRAGAGARQLVPALLWLSPLLPQPSPTLGGVRLGGGCLAIPRGPDRWKAKGEEFSKFITARARFRRARWFTRRPARCGSMNRWWRSLQADGPAIMSCRRSEGLCLSK